MAADERRRRGKSKMAEIAQIPEMEPSDAFVAASVDQVFGWLWQRPGLADRDRRLITLGILGARGLERELETHVGGALRSGDLSPAELMEVVLQVAHYAGWPNAAEMYAVLLRVCEKLGLEVPEA